MLSSNKKTSIVAFGMLVATFVCVGLTWFLFSIVSDESTRVKAAETEIAVLEAKTHDLIEAKKGLLKHADAISDINRSFISEEHFVDFVRLIEALGRTSGVTLKINNASLPEKGGTVRVSIEVAGGYEQITHFIILVDHIPYPSIIANISINSENAERGDRMRALLRLDVFNYSAQ